MALKINTDLPFLRQYDKLIAVVVLVILLVSLGYLTSAGAARKQDEATYIQKLEGLKPSGGAVAAMEMRDYEAATRALRAPFQLSPLDAQQAGLLSPERRVSCVNAACQKPIPFEAAACPFCDAKQPPAKPSTEGLDSDRDGIADKDENRLGLNPQDPSDAKGDLDGDGFNNLEELQAGTDPKAAGSHPALVNLLRVKELRGKRLPLIFSGVNTMPNGKKQLVFNLVGQGARTYWVKEGDPIGETDYVTGKVEIKSEERSDPNMPGIKRRVDVSTVVVKRKSDNKELVLRVNESGMNTDVEAVIVLPLDNSEYSVLENGTFKVRDETYRVVSVDNGATSVVIENVATRQQKVVRKLD